MKRVEVVLSNKEKNLEQQELERVVRRLNAAMSMQSIPFYVELDNSNNLVLKPAIREVKFTGTFKL